MLPQWLANGVVIMMSGAFVVNFLGQFVVHTWAPDPYVYGLCGATLPVALGLRRPAGTPPTLGDPS